VRRCYKGHAKKQQHNGKWHCLTCSVDAAREKRRTPEGKRRLSEINKKVAQRAKEEGYQAYGGKCCCCGETEIRFMTIDHITPINDRNRSHSGTALWKRLRQLGWPKDEYRMMCFNCNIARHWNDGVCPHEETDGGVVAS
jgi:hypothetical protein